MKNVLSENLRIFRVKNGFSQSQLGEMLGLTRKLYNMIESGMRGVKTDRLLKICEVTGMSPNDLLGYEGGDVRHVVLTSLLDWRCIDKLAKSATLQRVINQIILSFDKLEKEAAQYANDH